MFFCVLCVFSSCVSFDGIGCVCDERLIFPFWRLFLQILISLRSNSSRRIAAYLLFCSPSLDSEVLVVLTRAAEGKTADVLRQEFLVRKSAISSRDGRFVRLNLDSCSRSRYHGLEASTLFLYNEKNSLPGPLFSRVVDRRERERERSARCWL